MSTKSKPESPQSASEEHELVLPSDFRMTKQRREVYEVLMQHRNHPTAADVR